MEHSGSLSMHNDTTDEKNEVSTSTETPTMVYITFTLENAKILLTDEQRLQLEEQIRMFVQLLTQSYLISLGIPELNAINASSKQIMMELRQIASERTLFHAHNLDGAVDIINEYENKKDKIHIRSNYSSKALPGIPCIDVKKTIYNSKVFMYPELLPICGFSRRETVRPHFTCAEDNLIAIYLDKFSSSATPIHDIQAFLMPFRTVYQVKLRIKNAKPKCSEKNSIAYYFKHKQLPSFPRTTKAFDPDDVKAPKDHPRNVLPAWIKKMSGEVKKRKLPVIQPNYIVFLPQNHPLLPCPSVIRTKTKKPPFILPKGNIKLLTPPNKIITPPKGGVNELTVTTKHLDNKMKQKKNKHLDDVENTNSETENLDSNVVLSNDSIVSKQNKAVVLANGKIISTERAADANSNKGDFPDALNVVHIKEYSENLCNAVHSVKGKISKTIDYFPDSSGKDCGVIIKSEVDESDESTQDECMMDNARTPDSVSSSFTKNFIGNKIQNECNDVTSELSADQCNFSIKQEIEDDNEMAKTSEFVHDISISKCDTPIKSNILDNKKSTQDAGNPTCFLNGEIVKSEETVVLCKELSEDMNNALNVVNEKVSKTVEYIPHSNEKDYIVIKSEVVDESDQSLQGACMVDSEMAGALDTPPNTITESNDIQITYYRSFERRKVENGSSGNVAVISESKPSIHECNFPIKQEIEENSEITNTSEFVHDISTNKSIIPVKSEVVDDSEKLLQDAGNPTGLTSRPVMRTNETVVKSTSLEVAHLKNFKKRLLKRKEGKPSKKMLVVCRNLFPE